MEGEPTIDRSENNRQPGDDNLDDLDPFDWELAVKQLGFKDLDEAKQLGVFKKEGEEGETSDEYNILMKRLEEEDRPFEEPLDNLDDLNLDDEEAEDISRRFYDEELGDLDLDGPALNSAQAKKVASKHFDIELENLDKPGPNEDEQFFKTEEVNLRKKLEITMEKKNMLKSVFGVTVNKTAGKASKKIYSRLNIVKDDDNNIVSVMYDSELLLKEKWNKKKKKNELEWSDNKDIVEHFKTVWKAAITENEKLPENLYGRYLGFALSEETTSKINKDASKTMKFTAEKIYESIWDSKYLSEQEIAELRGVFLKDWDTIFGSGNKNLVKNNIRALEQEKLKWTELWLKEPVGKRKEVLKKAIEGVTLRMDEIKTRLNVKPGSKLGIEIIKEEASASYLTTLDKFKKWVGENKFNLTIAGFSVGGFFVAVAGFLLKFFENTKDVVIAGAQGLAYLGNLALRISKNLGPIMAAIGAGTSWALTLMSNGIGFLAHHLWLLAVALIYPIYRIGKKPKKSRRKTK